MGKFDNIIIVSDVDGTYRAHDEAGIKRNAERIEYFKQNGGNFCLATGRILPTVRELYPDIRQTVNAPCILGNGTYIYDFAEEKRYYDSYLDADVIWDTLQMIDRDYPEVGIRITCADGTFLVPKVNEGLKRDISGEFSYILREKAFADMTAQDKLCWNKIVLHIADPTVIDEIQRKCEDEQIDGIIYVKSWSTLLEIIPSEGTKGKMLSNLKHLLCKPEAIIYAVGDYDNDVDMLGMADVAVCPENAVDAVKQIADIHVCHFNAGAIGDLIERLDREFR